MNLPQEKQPKARQRKFRRELVRQLVGDVKNVPKRKKPSVEDGNRLDGKLHVLYPLEGATKVKDSIVGSNRAQGVKGNNQSIIVKPAQTHQEYAAVFVLKNITP